MKHLKINPELQRLIPPLTVDEFNQLEANILAEGIRESIIVWQDTIVDGHNRYQIAQRHNLKYDTSEMYFKSLDDCKEWMILNQFGRRNLSNYQRSVLALALEQVFTDKAKINLKLSEGRGKKGFHNCENLFDKIFEASDFNDGKCFLDNKEIKEDDLIRFLSFEQIYEANTMV